MIVFHGFTKRYERRGIFNLEEVLPYIGHTRVFDGTEISLTSDRYRLFEQNSACVTCGIEGLYFALERSAKRIAIQVPGTGRHRYEMSVMISKPPDHRVHEWHLNLYALREDGTEVLMTKDHIIPRSKGGQDVFWNYQTMCAPCNSRKGCRLPLAASAYAGA